MRSKWRDGELLLVLDRSWLEIVKNLRPLRRLVDYLKMRVSLSKPRAGRNDRNPVRLLEGWEDADLTPHEARGTHYFAVAD